MRVVSHRRKPRRCARDIKAGQVFIGMQASRLETVFDIPVKVGKSVQFCLSQGVAASSTADTENIRLTWDDGLCRSSNLQYVRRSAASMSCMPEA